MRFLFPAAAMAMLAACGTTPAPPPTASVTPAALPQQRGGLIGLTATELGLRFGRPRIQVREGDGTKVQFAASRCILDAYLYPQGGSGAAARVTHVDARTRDGRDTSQAECIAAIETR